MEFKDYYTTLGVPKTATDTDIKRAYRKLARKYHPDLNPGDKTAEAKFKEINEANEVLGDPEKRKKYDELGANWRMYEQAAQQGGAPPGNVHFEGGWPGGGQGGTTYRTMSAEDMREMFGTDNPFSDFFQTFFGGGFSTGGFSDETASRRARAQRPRRGRDLEQTVDLTLEEAFSGATRRVLIQHPDKPRTIDVRIPAGVKEGARVRSSGEGESVPGGKSGDLFLIVRLLPHPRFERRGQDLYVRVPVPVTTAVLGGEVPVSTISGSTLRLKVPEMTPAGRVFRLRGQGMPVVGRPAERGDLYATADLQIPPTLSPAQRKLYEELKTLES